jgi:sulfur carrier protein
MTTETSTIEITVNGKPISLAAGSTIRDFLASRKLADSMAIVERNGVIIPRPAYPDTPLEAGDVLEVVHAVGGG